MDAKLKALILVLVESAIANIDIPTGAIGPRGLKGEAGESFDPKLHLHLITNYIDSIAHTLVPQLTEEQLVSLKGDKGDIGPQGEKGESFSPELHRYIIANYIDSIAAELKGEKGEQGERGYDGESFSPIAHRHLITNYIDSIANELRGEKGETGPAGEKGETGPAGKDGLDGKDGESFSPTVHRHLITNYIDSISSELRGEKGDKGDQGERGEKGDQGDRGEQGEQGERGERGPRGQRGATGDKGEQGDTGPSGAPGRNGESGRPGKDGDDAPHIARIDLEGSSEEFSLLTTLSNGEELRTNSIALPQPKQASGGGVQIFNTGIDVNGENSVSLNFTGSGVTVETTDGVSTINISSTILPPEGANVVIPNVPCEPSVYVGAAVRMLASNVATLALADSVENSNVLGFIESKATSTSCNIRVLGASGDIFSGLDVSKEYYLSDISPGGITTSVPITSGHVKLKLGQPMSDKSFLVLKGERTVRA